jgi:methylenetetrahydrofolate dehydrogenase (NADP+) / methenyltetrahydrofolate cyclohydrolase
MTLLDGKKIAKEIITGLKKRTEVLRTHGVIVKLTAFNVGDHEPSRVFLRIKKKKSFEAGIDFDQVDLPSAISKDMLLEEIKSKSKSSAITFQLPLPENLASYQAEILNVIPMEKDVDLLTEGSRRLLEEGAPNFMPPTAAGILRLLDAYEIDISAHNILIVGQGELVGKPMAIMLKNKGVEFMTANRQTENIEELIQNATLIITATGQPELIRADNVQDGVIIVDAGTAESDGRLVGDVEVGVAQKASFFTPVPGGVGPMTVAMLLSNVVEASERQGIKS